MNNNLFQIESETPWEDLGNGIKRQIYGYDDSVMMVKVKFEAGAIGVLHQHHHAQVTYVESGVFEASIDGNVKTLKQGDGFYAPPHKTHGVVCKETGVLIDVFSPHRADFLK
ncbi:cupin domain-containing protein [Pedobacter sp. SD-b]|uniref:Cupin domain-containing protein n=1 Tax=Pedobacter segetis TaxID=2793069 RepID=A0ABS1BHJ6_9SPHI|nr:cupin domain-containing protein [Pedobacter segetis]MBK0382357.1 cupin domain-containing protein [Pedobacter segetis]